MVIASIKNIMPQINSSVLFFMILSPLILSYRPDSIMNYINVQSRHIFTLYFELYTL